MSKGKVYLVGAGPGDKELLTVKAVRLIQEADVIVYDRLVSESIMELIPEGCRLIDVGKNVGNHPVPQHEINQILLREGLAGGNVVRLKGGDPFVFGRGGEEFMAVQDAGIWNCFLRTAWTLRSCPALHLLFLYRLTRVFL